MRHLAPLLLALALLPRIGAADAKPKGISAIDFGEGRKAVAIYNLVTDGATYYLGKVKWKERSRWQEAAIWKRIATIKAATSASTNTLCDEATVAFAEMVVEVNLPGKKHLAGVLARFRGKDAADSRRAFLELRAIWASLMGYYPDLSIRTTIEKALVADSATNLIAPAKAYVKLHISAWKDAIKAADKKR